MTNPDIDVAEILKSILGDKLDLKVSQFKKIISCETCKGVGFTEKDELSCYHKREYTTIHNACYQCKGDGRLVETTTRIRFDARYPHKDGYITTVATVPYSQDPITKPETVFSTHGTHIEYLEHFK